VRDAKSKRVSHTVLLRCHIISSIGKGTIIALLCGRRCAQYDGQVEYGKY
jgi:hypothetical protein